MHYEYLKHMGWRSRKMVVVNSGHYWDSDRSAGLCKSKKLLVILTNWN